MKSLASWRPFLFVTSKVGTLDIVRDWVRGFSSFQPAQITRLKKSDELIIFSAICDFGSLVFAFWWNIGIVAEHTDEGRWRWTRNFTVSQSFLKSWHEKLNFETFFVSETLGVSCDFVLAYFKFKFPAYSPALDGVTQTTREKYFFKKRAGESLAVTLVLWTWGTMYSYFRHGYRFQIQWN